MRKHMRVETRWRHRKVKSSYRIPLTLLTGLLIIVSVLSARPDGFPLLETGYVWFRLKALSVLDRWSQVRALREQNAELGARSDAAFQLGARNTLLEAENRVLRLELETKNRGAYPMVTAEVVARNSDTWHQSVVINRGSHDGVRQHMAVVNWQGLVGKIIQTEENTSTVQLITDAKSFGAGVRVPTGDYGFVETQTGGHVVVKFSASNPGLVVGDPVLTSGLGVLPPDLLIGYVDRVETTAAGKVALIRPAVDLNKLSVVHVVLSWADLDRGVHVP